MDALDPNDEWQRLTNLYREKADEELLLLAREFDELTPSAQQVLKLELTRRRLEMPAAEQPPERNIQKREPIVDPESPYAEDRKLVEVCTVWSARDAAHARGMLLAAGIPAYFGAEQVESVDEVTSDFRQGIKVQVMKIGEFAARSALQWFAPEDVPASEQVPEEDDSTIHCPSCHSEDVIFGDPDGEPEAAVDTTSGFDWTCAACGHQWTDEGVGST